MRGFEPIQQVPTQSFRAARSMSPQKVHRDRAHCEVQQFQPSNSSFLRDHTLGSFTRNTGYAQSHQQTYVYEEPPKNPYLFQVAGVYQSPVTNNVSAKCTKDASVATEKLGSTASPKTGSTASPKTDVTPSTSDHSDVDDLAPRSIHSPSTSDNDAHTPPSSGPGSPAVPKSFSP